MHRTAAVAVLLPLAIMACAPGGISGGVGGLGAIGTNPTLQITYSPAISWTWFSPSETAGQQSSLANAQTRINADIQLAVLQALSFYGFSSTGVTISNAITPQNINIGNISHPCADDSQFNMGFVQGRAVGLICTGTPTAAIVPNILNSTINIQSSIPLAQAQWQNLANKVWGTLAESAGVLFEAPIQVTL